MGFFGHTKVEKRSKWGEESERFLAGGGGGVEGASFPAKKLKIGPQMSVHGRFL